jgi:hypothetical protein
LPTFIAAQTIQRQLMFKRQVTDALNFALRTSVLLCSNHLYRLSLLLFYVGDISPTQFFWLNLPGGLQNT